MRGHTLIELVVVITVLGIVSGLLLHTVSSSAGIYVDLRSRSANAADARHAFELMAREIQEIASTTTTDISTMTSTALTFNTEGGTSIAYSFSGRRLTRDGQILLDDLSAFAFAYYKKDGTTASAAADVWTIEVLGTLNRHDRDLKVRTRIFPRNFTARLVTWQKT